jgi:hypothetical protein
VLKKTSEITDCYGLRVATSSTPATATCTADLYNINDPRRGRQPPARDLACTTRTPDGEHGVVTEA